MDDEPPPSRRNALIALVVVVLIAIAGFMVSQVLQKASRTEDCLMRGGRNCAPLDPNFKR